MKSTNQNTVFSSNKTLNIQGRLIDLAQPKIMGILNVTPDSFYDGGKYLSEAEILHQAERMIREGATFIDIGAYSSRPGASDVPLETELDSAKRAVRMITKAFPEAMVTVDTFRSHVAEAAIAEGAVMVNDISGGNLDPNMYKTIAQHKVPYVVMHMRGTPQSMSQQTGYQNLLKEVIDYFHQKINTLHQLGIYDTIIDPGFGFAKTIGQNFELLNRLEMFRIFDKPILVGLSRKSMIWKTLNISPDDALNGTTVLQTMALLKGANILRVHDVKEASEMICLMNVLHGANLS